MKLAQHFATTAESAWRDINRSGPSSRTETSALVEAAGEAAEVWAGFGGCFNELGWQALRELAPRERGAVLDALFGAEGLRLDLGRIPMGASDYASEWHSYADRPGDFALEHFSIERDRTELLPYIQEALSRRPDLCFFASPWSPPAWMKSPAVYNHGRFRMEARYLDAYARYFARFIAAYRAEGVRISQVHPQNEPAADQKFPSCVWSGEQLREFIGGHLGPVLAREAPEVEVWLGTMNTADYPGMFQPVIADEACRRHLRGLGLQWAGKGVAHRLRQLHPELPVWQTENECGDGTNSWDYAHYVFDLVLHYLDAGTTGYVYWNMVLPPGGVSSWGWRQNAMITVDPAGGTWSANPEYHVMRHFSAFVRPGSRRLPLRGSWAGGAAAFVLADGRVALVSHNSGARPRPLRVRLGGGEFETVLPARSFNTLICSN